MIEFDVDMGRLLEEESLDRIILNDENGEHEPIEFVPRAEADRLIRAIEESRNRMFDMIP